MRFVEAGLRDISVSRKTVKWGLPWPEDPEHVVYVWYDALTSYLSGIGYGDDEMQYEKYWPAQLHLIGKEIIRFHCVYWPAFLWAAGEQLPKHVFAHGWLLFDQQKMSKSKGNVAYPEPIARTIGVDALRYYLLRDVPFGQDGNFSHDALLTRYNSDLANGLGNLASRTLAMIERYRGGEVCAEGRTGRGGEAMAESLVAAARADNRAIRRPVFFARAGNHLGGNFACGWLPDQQETVDDGGRSQAAQGGSNGAVPCRGSAASYGGLGASALPEPRQRCGCSSARAGRWRSFALTSFAWGHCVPARESANCRRLFRASKRKRHWRKIETMEEEMKNPQGSSPRRLAHDYFIARLLL